MSLDKAPGPPAETQYLQLAPPHHISVLICLAISLRISTDSMITAWVLSERGSTMMRKERTEAEFSSQNVWVIS